MVANKNELQGLISSLLKEMPFVRRGDSWYLHNKDTVVCIHFGKSQWGGQYSIGIAASIREMDPADFPQPHKCPIRVFLSLLVPDRTRLDQYLDLEERSLSEDERVAGISEALRQHVLPIARKFTSLEGLNDFLKEERARRFAISLKAKEFLCQMFR